MVWIRRLALIVMLYGMAGAAILSVRMSRGSTIRGELVLRLAEFVNATVLLILVSGPAFGGAPGALGIHIQLEGYPISELSLGGNITGLLAILMTLKLKPVVRAAAQLVLGPQGRQP
jgi:hypothetical protein